MAPEIVYDCGRQALDHENKQTLRNLNRFGDDVPWLDETSFTSALRFLPARLDPAVVGYEAKRYCTRGTAPMQKRRSSWKQDRRESPFVDVSRTSI